MRSKIRFMGLLVSSLGLTAACDGASSDVQALTERLEALEAEVSTLRTQLDVAEKDASDALTKSTAGADTLAAWDPAIAFCRDLSTILSVDGEGDLVVEGANLHVRSGLGATTPIGGDTNGKGNLIVGYNEVPEDDSVEVSRSGSHNLVVGPEHSYDASGAVIFGRRNTVAENHSGVLGGYNNAVEATGDAYAIHSVVVGGLANRAGNEAAVVVGGVRNVSDGLASLAVGGVDNTSSGRRSVVLGGLDNRATEDRTTILGGNDVTDDPTAGSIFPAPTERWGSTQPQ